MERLPPLYAVEGRAVDLEALEAEYLSSDHSLNLQLVWLFLEVRRLREIARLAAEVLAADLEAARGGESKHLVEAVNDLDRALEVVVFRHPAQTSLFSGGQSGR